METAKEIISFLLERFKIERRRFDRSGIYAYTQRLLAYNSNRIEGSTLTEEQTASLFDNGTLPRSDSYYRAKDVEEMNGHFLMFNKMIDTLEEPLTEKLIKPGMTDEESAAYWQGHNAKIVVIKHGMEGSHAFTRDGQKFSIKPFPVTARKGFGGGDGYGSGFLYGLYQGWEIIDCLEFGSAEASMMVRSNNCSDALPGPEEVHAFIRAEKEQYGEMVARA